MVFLEIMGMNAKKNAASEQLYTYADNSSMIVVLMHPNTSNATTPLQIKGATTHYYSPPAKPKAVWWNECK